jgi:excisionase family DNA binding protein
LVIPRFSSILSGVKTEADVMPEEIMTLKEVAEYLKLAEKTAYRLAAEGKIPGFKVGGSWRFRKDAIENWIDQQTECRRT